MFKKTNLKTMSAKQLSQLQADIVVALADRKRETISGLRTRFRALAESEGLTLEDVLGSQRGRWRRTPVAVKYRDPNDAKNTWTGRGRKPRWLSKALIGGKSLDELEVR